MGRPRQYKQTKDLAGNAVTETWDTACTASAPNPESGKGTCGWNTTLRPQGTYELQAALTDQVASADGGPNTGTATPAGNATVIVDRTPPEIGHFAPSLEEDDYEFVEQEVVNVFWTQTDTLSGVASTSIAYNTAADGGCQDGWREIGASNGSGDAALTWDTAEVPDGLRCMRAVAADRAGNSREARWQAIVAPRVSATAGSADANAEASSHRRYYAGAAVGRPTGAYAGNVAYGVQAQIPTPKRKVSYRGESNFTALRVGIGDSLLTNSVEAGLITEGWCRSDMSRGDPERWRIYGVYADTGLTRYRMCVGKGGTCRSDVDQGDEDCNDDTNGDDLPAGRKYRFRSELIKHDGRVYGRMWWARPGGGYRLMRLQSRRDKGRYHIERSFGWRQPAAASETTAS